MTDVPDPFVDSLLARAIGVVASAPEFDVKQVRADMLAARTDPDAKAETVARSEQLDIDMAMLMALTDDTLEHHLAGDVEQVILDATRTVRFSMDVTTDQKRASQLIMRLSRLLYMELLDKQGGDRETLMASVAARAETGSGGLAGLFAPDLLNNFKLDRS